MHAEGGTGVHAAPRDPPEEEAHGMRAEGGTGVHAAHLLWFAMIWDIENNLVSRLSRCVPEARASGRRLIPTLFLPLESSARTHDIIGEP